MLDMLETLEDEESDMIEGRLRSVARYGGSMTVLVVALLMLEKNGKMQQSNDEIDGWDVVVSKSCLSRCLAMCWLMVDTPGCTKALKVENKSLCAEPTVRGFSATFLRAASPLLANRPPFRNDAP